MVARGVLKEDVVDILEDVNTNVNGIHEHQRDE